MTYTRDNVSTHTRNVALACIGTTLAMPVLAALFTPAAPILVPLAVVVPFITMAVLDADLSASNRHA